ncbi:type VI secretion system membrane subunit TssM [Photobacterium chitinilyticum]|uniref:Type VI secretion system membrane subunit TssM n=1 Tax=Photobacterium chitinilyticum TaxID=2485123 RepID=A0A444JVX5_9GAMM|nr:type VI secretion system membrane subunit TssM [Photobacterium chitinilyticum]RWX57229.1 type VI secretion system membrane subunit TssM [Photobacterium chitinilyticum]
MFKKGFFKWLGDILCSKWAISLLGLLAISLLIWFGGPLVAVAGSEPLSSPVSRLTVLLVLALLWGAINIGSRTKSKKQNENAVKTLLDGDKSNNADSASKKEIDTLRSRIVQALEVLNSSSLVRGQSVYQLPWYILIGPPGTGKTTALNNSGLEFPLKDKLGNDPLAGIGGTRHCDWWFTNKAVLIDTAGRYTTQDSNSEQDSRAWLGFLGLLKKYRTRRPINGAIVTVSLASLLTQTRTERTLHARAIKHRIQELQNQLGMHFPVYVVLTKADLVAGFSEFFSDLSHEDREQVWGMTFPEKADDPERGVVALFNREFHCMLRRLVERMNTRMQSVRDIDKRTLVYEFPKQLRSLQAAADDFLKEVFTPNTFEEAPMLRGVFIASATQEGMPIDRVVAENSGGLGLGQIPLQQPGSDTKGYFIKRLFEEVIFPEQYLGTDNRNHQKQNLWLRRGVLASCVVSMSVASALWLNSYRWNKALITQASAAVDEYQQLISPELSEDTDVVTLVHALDQLKNIPAGYSERMLDADEVERVGLYQGDKIGQPAKAAYERGLQGYFAPYLVNSLQQEMATNDSYLEYLYETLKTYLMLFDAEHYEEDQVTSWFSVFFERMFPGEVNIPLRQSLMEHTKNVLKSGITGVGADDDAIQTARNILTQMPLSERAYQRLKIEYIDSHVPDFRLTDVLGAESHGIFERRSGKSLSEGISGLYTYSGFHGIFQLENKRIVKNLMEDSWVYGDELLLGESARKQVTQSVNDKYYRDYVYEWTQLLGDVRLKSYSNAKDGLAQAKVLAGSEQPLESLILGVQKQLRLTTLPVSKNAKVAGAIAGNAASVALEQRKSRIARYLPNEMPVVELELPGKEIENKFSEFLALNENDLSALNESLVLLHNYLAELRATGDRDSAAYKSLLRGETQGDLNSALSQVKDHLPLPFNQWVNQLERQTRKLAKQGSKIHLNTIWQDTVVREYKAAIKGKYPFSSRARKEVRLKDFGRFFGYGGTMDTFFTAYLEPFVDTSKRNWRFTKSIGVSKASLRAFEQARRIRDVFFEPESQFPRVEFGIESVYLDQHISNFKFELGGQSMMYRHGPTRVMQFTWPWKGESSKVRLVFTPPQSGHSITKNYAGSWGLFRMLDEAARHRSKTRKDHLVKVEVKGNRAELQLLPSSVAHPFWLKDLERFSCPMKL